MVERLDGSFEINMGNLVITYGKDLRSSKINQFLSQLLLDRQPSLLAKESIKMYGMSDWSDAVF